MYLQRRVSQGVSLEDMGRAVRRLYGPKAVGVGGWWGRSNWEVATPMDLPIANAPTLKVTRVGGGVYPLAARSTAGAR